METARVATQSRAEPIPPASILDVSPRRLRFREWSGPRDRRTFVCLHGLGGSHLNWIAVADQLSEAGRVLAIDLPGFGCSSPASGITCLDEMCDGVRDTIDALAVGRVTLVGQGMGAMVALLQARGCARVDSVIATAPPLAPAEEWARAAHVLVGPAGMLAERAAQTLVHSASIGGELTGWLTEQFIQDGSADPTAIPDWVSSANIEDGNQLLLGPAVAGIGSASASLVSKARTPGWIAHVVSQVTCPVLVIHGTEDRHAPAKWSTRACADHDGWTLRLLEGVGHNAHMEAADRWMDAVEEWFARPLEVDSGGRARADTAGRF